MKQLLYLTADGVLQPLGFSQVVRVVEGLARRGFRYRLFSLEREQDLAREARVREVRSRLNAAGVIWQWAPWREGGGGKAALDNEVALIRAATQTSAVGGIHARAYHSAVAALTRHTVDRVPYLFDTRSYWFDERLEEGRWFTSPLRLGVARGIEHQLFSQASAVVTLTDLQADDVRQGRFGPSRHRAVQCITTCADYDDFTRQPASECRRVPADVRARLSGQRVIGVIGSINRSYLVTETLELCRLMLERDSQAHLLILSGQQREYAERLEALKVDPSRYTITRADHDAMPQWLSLIHWAPLLLQPDSPAKRASMPTKLAEFFACGVQPIHFGCNVEVGQWVQRSGLGFSLPDVSPRSLAAAADRVVSQQRPVDLPAAREHTRGHFSLEAGLQKYEQVLTQTFEDVRR